MLNRPNLVLGAAVLTAISGAAPAQQLIWSDEFDGTSLDLTKWEPMIGNGQAYGIAGWGNNELEYYTGRPENALVSDGTLKIIARRENYSGYQYTSARLRTLNKGDFNFGRIEARIKLPSTQGIWPAFWMLPTNSIYGGWASGGEIDIMEKINTQQTVHGTLHFGGQWPNNTSTGSSYSPGVDLINTFHTYAIEWTEDDITWYFDDVPFGYKAANQWYSEAAPGDANAPFDQTFHMLLNVAVGGNWPGYPDGSSVFPQTMEVDYVRVYSLGDVEPVAQEPFNAIVPTMPARIQMEEYDLGGPGVAYSDAELANQGGAFRPTEGVDIENTAGGGYNVGYIRGGEWIEHTIDFPRAGTYNVRARYASNTAGGSFGFSIDDQDVTGNIVGGGTGGWQNWITLQGEIEIDSAGTRVVRWENRSPDGNEYNLDWYEIYPDVSALAEPVTLLENGDIQAFIALFLAQDLSVDFTGDGILDNSDIYAFVQEYISWID